MSSKKTLCQITTGKRSYYVLSEVKDGGENGISLTVSDGQYAWSGDLSDSELDLMSLDAKMSYQSFVADTVAAFTHGNKGKLSFQYTMTPMKEDRSMELSWKKYVPSEDIKFQLGTVMLEPSGDSSNAIKQIFDHSIHNMSSLEERISFLDTDNQRLSQERGQVLKRLEKCVTAKEDMEKDLYSKFVAVINSKKEKIRELKNKGEADDVPVKSKISRPDGESSAPGVVLKNESRLSPVTRKPLDEDDDNHSNASSKSEDLLSPVARQPCGDDNNDDVKVNVHMNDKSSDGDNTDEEITPAPTRRKPPPKRKMKAEADDSLILDDGIDLPDTSASSRPRRQRPGLVKKQTPSKPILPKVSSGESASTSRKLNLRKSTSSSSRSTGTPDPDELLGGL